MDGERDDRRRGAADRRREGSGDKRRDATRDAHVAEISARLRRACQHMPDAEFTSMVLDMAETRLRFADIDARAFRYGLHGADGPADPP